MSKIKLKIPKSLWRNLIDELRIRGEAKRESGAFLLGKADSTTICEFICYDDLDPNSLEKGFINFNGKFLSTLWKHCENKGLKVLADIHTHPGNWTGQSELDKVNPMISQRNHIALIAPNFALNKKQLLEGVGIHLYLGNHKWQSFSSNKGIIKLIPQKKLKIDENNFNRLASGIMKKNYCTYEEANKKLSSFKLHLQCGEMIKSSASLQAAFITAINTGKRAFLGGITFDLPTDTKSIIPWPQEKSLNHIALSLGGKNSLSDVDCSFTLNFGLPADADGDCLEVVCNGWQGGVANKKDPIRLVEKDALTIGGVLAGALGVGLAFLKTSGIDPTSCDHSTGISLWRPDLHWLDENAFGPRLMNLPNKYWILGLGHLGQSYLWNIGLLPYKNTSEIQILLQDFDIMTPGNFSAGLLCERKQAGKLKTRVCSEWLEKRKFSSSIIERRFTKETKREGEEPFVGLCGFDTAESRVFLEDAGFDLLIECALGDDLSNFDKLSLHTFPGGPKTPNQIWGGPASAPRTMNEVVKKHFEESSDDCGILALTLSRKALSASFIGAVSGSFVVGELLRALNNGKRYEKIVLQLRSLENRAAIILKEYEIEMSRNGFVNVI